MNLTRTTTIIVPCRNEEGNLVELVENIIPILHSTDCLILSEGGSTDSTWKIASELSKKYPNTVKAIKQKNRGKFDAVLSCLDLVTTDEVMIWDADATVDFKANKNIYFTISSKESLITGDRLRGTREKGSMRFFNYIGNWLFALLWSPYLKRMPIDLLCGTKKFPTKILRNLPKKCYSLDPYGDFTIFLTAKIFNLEIISIPVLYRARSYGSTNIKRWKGGLLLLKLSYTYFFKKSSLSEENKIK